MLSVVITVKLHDFVNSSNLPVLDSATVDSSFYFDKTPFFFIHTFIFLSSAQLRSVTFNKTSCKIINHYSYRYIRMGVCCPLVVPLRNAEKLQFPHEAVIIIVKVSYVFLV